VDAASSGLSATLTNASTTPTSSSMTPRVQSFLDIILPDTSHDVAIQDYPSWNRPDTVRVIGGRGTALFSLEMRAGELIRRLISGELTNYEVVRTSPEPLHTLSATALSK
jgi:hypothetical protein